MIHQLDFTFSDLKITKEKVSPLLGFGNNLPSPFDEYLDEAFLYSEDLHEISAVFKIVGRSSISFNKNGFTAECKEFNSGKIILNQLIGSDELIFFICTAGRSVSEKADSLLKGEDPALGYIYDLLGTEIAEAVGDALQSHIRSEFLEEKENITNRFSPGYCQWNVMEQHKLFGLFSGKTVGVCLSQSALMQPIKSISAVIGKGKDVKYKPYNCNKCKLKHCYKRSNISSAENT